MARRETGAWLPIIAIVAGLALFGVGLATWELDAHISIHILIYAGIGILAGPFLPWVVCLLSHPWRRFHLAAFFLGSIPLLCCVATWFWEFEQHRRLPVFACLVIAGLEAWLGVREFVQARQSLHAENQTVESH